MAAKVWRMRWRKGEEGGRKRSRYGDEGAASVCWIFLEPARWVRMEGHLIAALRSRCIRESHESGVAYSVGE